jgi:hypothetical protein
MKPLSSGSGGTAATSGSASGSQQQSTTGSASSTTQQKGSSSASSGERQQGAAGSASTATRSDKAATTGSTSINLSTEQRTQVTRAFSSVKAEPLTNVTFNITVGETVPASVTTLHTCPGDVIQYLDGLTECRFVIVKDRIVIVEPKTRRIVTVIERTG